MKIGYIGLGKMGLNMSIRLSEKGHSVVGHTKGDGPKEAEQNDIVLTSSLKEMVGNLEAPRTVWIMVPVPAVDNVLNEITPLLEEGDTVIDGTNSFYKDSIRRGEELSQKGIDFLDAGVSGGPEGARNGACIMVGGRKEVFEEKKEVFEDLSVPEGFAYVGKQGAGHFVKMVHNGIEYGMMQSIAEGFNLMKNKSEYNLDLTGIAEVYNHGSVIESRLTGWLAEGFKKYGNDLEKVSGSVDHGGTGEWTIKEGERLGVSTPAIKSAYDFRVKSQESPSYTGKILSTLRNMFGGHSVGEDKD